MNMKVIAIPLLIAVLVVALAACAPLLRSGGAPSSPTVSAGQSAVSGGTAPAEARLITPQDAKARLEQESGIIVVDVRTQEEYDQGHLRASVLVPLDDLAALAPEKLPEKDAVLFLYCRSGRRSALAAQQLVSMGYTQVYDLGGILGWPYEITTE